MDGQYLVYAIVAGALLAAIALLQTISRGELSRLKVQPKPLMTPPERRVCLMIERALPYTRHYSHVRNDVRTVGNFYAGSRKWRSVRSH